MAPFIDGEYRPGGRWETRALAVMQHLADEHVIEVRDEGYTDALLMCGIALDLAEASGDASKMEYARRGWSAALRMLTPPPTERVHRHPGQVGGVMSTDERTEFDRIAEQYAASPPDVHDAPNP